MNKPSVTKIEVAHRVNLLHAGSESTNLENLVKCLYPCPDMRHFMIIIKKLLLSDIEIKHQITLLNQVLASFEPANFELSELYHNDVQYLNHLAQL